MPEQFRPFPRDPRYQIGDRGTVIGVMGQPLKMVIKMTHGRVSRYPTFGIAIPRSRLPAYRKGQTEMIYLHMAVLETWHGPRPSPDHRAVWADGDTLNCTAANLRWEAPA